MSEQQRRHVSALADGEIDPTLAHTTVSALASNQRLLGAWERYHLIGAAMRSEQVLPEFRLISAWVGARIAAEPIAPKRPVSRQGWAFPLAGAALVAGVALPSFFALRPEARLLQAATPLRRRVSSGAVPACRSRPALACRRTGPGEQAGPPPRESPGAIAGIRHNRLPALCDTGRLRDAPLVWVR